MKSYGIVIRITLLIVIGIGALACSRPTRQQELTTTFEKTGLSDMRAVDNMERKYQQMAMAAKIGRVLLDSKGEVIGVMFLTARGDFFESRDGKHASFIIRNHTENPLLKEFAKNDKKIMPIELSVEYQWH